MGRQEVKLDRDVPLPVSSTIACEQALLRRSLARSRETRFTRPNRRACSQATSTSALFSQIKPLFQSEAKPEAIDRKMIFYSRGRKLRHLASFWKWEFADLSNDLRSTTQNICFLISISAVTLKLISNGQKHIHFGLMQVLKNSMTWYFLTFRSLSSKLEFVYPPWSCGVEEKVLIFSSIQSRSRCLDNGKICNKFTL